MAAPETSPVLPEISCRGRGAASQSAPVQTITSQLNGLQSNTSQNSVTIPRVSSHKIVLDKKRSPTRSKPYCDEIIDILFSGKNIIKILGDNPFLWDGSYLGRICNKNIIDIFTHSGTKYWKLDIYGHERICIVKPIINGTASFCDEMKEYFGQSKLGTHRVKYHTKVYLLIEARTDSKGHVIEEITINNIDPTRDANFMKRVREIFVFRDIFGLSMTREKSIVVRWSDKAYIPPYPISFIEREMRPYDDRDVITITSEKKWFGDISIGEVLRSMLKITSDTDISNIIAYLRNKIEQAIERIDRDLVGVIQPIIAKLIRRLTLGDDSNGSPTPDWE